MPLNLCLILQATWHSCIFSILGDSNLELNTSGMFNFRLVTNHMCQTTQLYFKTIFPSGRKYNTATAKMRTLVENTDIPNLSLMPLSSLARSLTLLHSLWILSSSLILPRNERKETFMPKPRWWINWPWNHVLLIHDYFEWTWVAKRAAGKTFFTLKGRKAKMIVRFAF